MAEDKAGTRRLVVLNAGFWRGPRLRRILALAGWHLAAGLPRPGDSVGVWGAGPTAWRGATLARWWEAPLVRVEDAFLRSVIPGRARGPLARRGPVGLLIDPTGLHFDPASPSLIEHLITSGATGGHEAQAAAGIERLRGLDLSKYNAHLPGTPLPGRDYVLVIDQTRRDASLMGAGRRTFLAMLEAARAEHPGRPLVIRSHPESAAGGRRGHLSAADLQPGEMLCSWPLSPWHLVEGAAAVYAVSSQLGYEALLAGHRPVLFGTPFYAGWGLTDDRAPTPARRRTASREALFAASHLMAPVWYDPCRDRLTDFHGAVDQLEAEARAFREDAGGHLAYGMRLWKRPSLARIFDGAGRGVRFTEKPSAEVTLAWAGRAAEVELHGPPLLRRVEDGFLRSRGLGAQLTPALSLVADDLGIYYDPTRESRLERLVAAPLPPGGRERAERLIARLRAEGISKYNLQGAVPDLPQKAGVPTILVPGQVEDDASVRLGAGAERSNLALLERVRAENPQAVLVWKPHPDVEAGLRPGTVAPADIARLADAVAEGAPVAALLGQVDEVWTMTSTLGFEALLRGLPVTVLGAPFYAGWGLTRDLGPVPARRQARPDLAALAHAALIAYPRYMDPVSGLPCPVEVALKRLANPVPPPRGMRLRLLSKAQGLLAGHAWLWR